MCEQCYEDYGSPNPDAISSAAIPLVDAVYEWSAVGGNLHIILDDWNIDDENLASCRDYDLTIAEAACLAAFEAMTIEQRAACLGEYDGFARPVTP
jgi:hypothetical protein